MEAHVCVLQTALDLAEAGKSVFVVADAVGSRRPESRDVALRRMEAAGITAVTTEMVVFEWLRTAAAPAFKPLSKLIR
jgi:nicotinamidase-related amidase